LFKRQPRRPKLSRVKIDIDDELDFDLEEGDMIVHIKHNGDIGKVCMPDMNSKVAQSEGYNKLLKVLEILKPGTKEEFIKYHENKRKGTVH
jgi:hypothetical protein|tara:strand:- start:472 stop:744 length:273 start_codon:yes stop_codon:yes gene_type:complete